MATKNQENTLTTGLPFPDILEEGNVNLTYDQIRANLQIPIPSRLISGKKQRVKNGPDIIIDYVNITDLKDILDERAGLWTAAIKSHLVMGDQLGVVVSVTIYTVNGEYTQDGNGVENLNHSGFGDTFSNAYAQAFRRACEGHGLGRHLWRKHETKEAQYQDTQQPTQPASNSTPSPGAAKVAQAQPSIHTTSNGSNDFPITQKQLTYAENICVERGYDMNSLSQELYKKNADQLTKKEASKFIDHISKFAA